MRRSVSQRFLPTASTLRCRCTTTKTAKANIQLAVLHLPDLKFMSRLDMTSHYLPIDITWVDNKRLVMGVGEETAFAEAPIGDRRHHRRRHRRQEQTRAVQLRHCADSMGAQRNILKIPRRFRSDLRHARSCQRTFLFDVYPSPEAAPADAQAHMSMIYDIEASSGHVKEFGRDRRGRLPVHRARWRGALRVWRGQNLQGTRLLPCRRRRPLDGIARPP